MKSTSLRMTAVAALTLALSGCATIMGQPTQTIPIASTPSDAAISVVDETGAEVFKGMTPTSVTLQKSTGRYWGKKSFTITITKAGYATQSIPVTATANGYYIAGNFLFGGLIGWFIVDPQSGNMYTLSPEAISATLPATTASHNNKNTDGSVAIMLVQDVPDRLKQQMVRIN
jgi:hypothetical protein